MSPPAVPTPWSTRDRLILLVLFAVGIVIRAILIGVEGYRDDMDQFARWIAHITNDGLGQLYTDNPGGPVTFGPVMGYVWWLLGIVQPAFATATDASDPTLNAWMKVPASLADLGMAAVVVFALRSTPRWAIVGAAAILLAPAIIDVSAWWGQYESMYTLPALAGVVGAAVMRRNGIAAVCFAIALATKPQAIPLVIPFVAWCWASGGWRECLRVGLIGAVTFGLLWLPFIPAGGPLAYLGNLRTYQDEVFNILSLHAWNPWSLLQEIAAGDQFIPDDVPIVGPITFRVIGFLLTGLVSIVVMVAVVRRPEPRTLVLATTASVLVFFCLMTQMHERYSYAALVIPVLLLADVRIRWWWVVLSVAVTLNLLAIIPPTPAIDALLSANGPLAIIGAVTITGLTFWLLSYLRRNTPTQPASVRSNGP